MMFLSFSQLSKGNSPIFKSAAVRCEKKRDKSVMKGETTVDEGMLQN